MWIVPGLRDEAVIQGLTVVDPATVVTTHLTELVRDNLADLLSYAETQKLLGELPPEYQKLLGELVPAGSPRPASSACCRACWPSGSRSATCR